MDIITFEYTVWYDSYFYILGFLFFWLFGFMGVKILEEKLQKEMYRELGCEGCKYYRNKCTFDGKIRTNMKGQCIEKH